MISLAGVEHVGFGFDFCDKIIRHYEEMISDMINRGLYSVTALRNNVSA
jgi:microsomal dipeptidase-like Zn-dependent dipeptidase